MSFARAKIKRFNEVTFCSPPVGSYTPKFDGTFPYPGTKSPPIRRPSRAGSVASLRSHGSNTRPSSRSSAGSSNSEDGRTKWPAVSASPCSPKQLQDRAAARTEEKGCREIPPSDERFVGEGKTEADKVIDVKVSGVKVIDVKVSDVTVIDVKVSEVKVSNIQVSDSDALEVKSTAEHGIASTELINSLRSEISKKCIAVEKLTLKVEELFADNRRKADELEKLVKENQSRTEKTEAVEFQLEKLRSEHSKTVEELERTKMVVKRLRQENRRKTTELSNAKAAPEKIPKSGSPTSIPEAKKSRLSQERLQNKSSRLTAQLQRSRVLLRLADACQNRRKSAENYSESKNILKQEEGRWSVKSPTKIRPKEDLNLKMVQKSGNKEEEFAKVHGTVARSFKNSVDANRSSVMNAIVATKTEAKTETGRQQDFTKTNTDETHLRRYSSCVSNAEDGVPSLSTETSEDWKIELEELRKQLDDVDLCLEEQMETWLERNNSIEDRKEELPVDRLKFDQVEPRCGNSFRTFPAKITESSAVGRSFERDLTKLHAIERDDLNRIRDKTRSEHLGRDRTPPEIDSCDKRTGQKRNSPLLSQKTTSLKAVYGREMKMETKTFRVDNNTNSRTTERARNTGVLSLSREFPREKVSACNKRQVDHQSPKPTGDCSKGLSQLATKTQSSEEMIVRSYEDFLVRSGRSHRLGTNDLKTRASTSWRPSVTKTDSESEKSFQTKDSEKDLSIVDNDDDDDPDSPSKWKKRYEELWTTAQPFRDLLSAFSAQKQVLSDRRRKTREEDSSVDRLCSEFSKLISHEHERRRMRQVVELKKQNTLLRIELEAIRRRRSAPPIITNRSGQQQQQPTQ